MSAITRLSQVGGPSSHHRPPRPPERTILNRSIPPLITRGHCREEPTRSRGAEGRHGQGPSRGDAGSVRRGARRRPGMARRRRRRRCQHRPPRYPRHAAPRRQHHQDLHRRRGPAAGRERSDRARHADRPLPAAAGARRTRRRDHRPNADQPHQRPGGIPPVCVPVPQGVPFPGGHHAREPGRQPVHAVSPDRADRDGGHGACRRYAGRHSGGVFQHQLPAPLPTPGARDRHHGGEVHHPERHSSALGSGTPSFRPDRMSAGRTRRCTRRGSA